MILVHGTWSRYKSWHQAGSPLCNALVEKGFQITDFLWSGYCGGFPGPVIVPQDAPELAGTLMLWQSEGEKLALFCKVNNLECPDVITHSHGLQVLVMAAIAGQRFRNVLSISGPIRHDMQPWREKARPNIQRWAQVVDPDDDMTIREGQAFDGRLGWAYDLPEADPKLNIHASGQGHSGLLLDIDAWDTLGLWAAFGYQPPASAAP